MKRKLVVLLALLTFVAICCFASYAGCSCDGETAVHEPQP